MKAAQDITKLEFRRFLSELVDELQDKKRAAELGRREGFILSIDNATVHLGADGLLPAGWEVLPHPAYSPDCNKPIEHVHGQLDDLMHKWLLQWRRLHAGGNPTPAECKAQCLAYFNALSPASLAADINTLPETWQEIINVGGSYTAGKFA